MIVLKVKDFSVAPGVRTPDEGNFSGQEYREKFLEPNLQRAILNKEKLQVILDGTLGYATSFLEEVFGGIVRTFGYEKVKEYLEVISNQRPFYIEDIKEYMEDAKNKKSSSK